MFISFGLNHFNCLLVETNKAAKIANELNYLVLGIIQLPPFENFKHYKMTDFAESQVKCAN